MSVTGVLRVVPITHTGCRTTRTDDTERNRQQIVLVPTRRQLSRICARVDDDRLCQVNRADCEIILCQDATRTDKSRLFVELSQAGVSELQGELDQRSVPYTLSWWGYDVFQIHDPDGNELLVPTSP